MGFYGNVREEELKLKVGEDFFSDFDRTAIPGNVDYCVSAKTGDFNIPDADKENFLWAECKRGIVDLLDAFAQLVLTIGKERTFETYMPPSFLGAFDSDKIAFIPFNSVMEIFYKNDFNWNVAPSDHSTREFIQVRNLIKDAINIESRTYSYKTDARDLAKFVKENFRSDIQNVEGIRISKNNFVNVYLKWRRVVMPTISINWNLAREKGILDADFYLADLLSKYNLTLKEKLNVLLNHRTYMLNRRIDDLGLFSYSQAIFTDKQAMHTQFWNKYVRPPHHEYWDYILERRDLLIPQDIRERKGSFFTPAMWVAKAQDYLTAALGENWQDEYVIWDCCAGTGNLLAGLLNKYNIWASTLDESDVKVMQDRIDNGANLLASHIFQFDFLNGDFAKLPNELRELIEDKERRKKLIVFINPPYAEHGDAKQRTGTGKNKEKVATETEVYGRSQKTIGTAARELFTQFLYRIYTDINGCVIGQFSKLKHLQGRNFKNFRQYFQARLLKSFLVPANTFDNVKGHFPIGFYVWDTAHREIFKEAIADVFNSNDKYLGIKRIRSEERFMIEWLRQFYDKTQEPIAFMRMLGSDVQNNQGVFLTLKLSPNDVKEKLFTTVTLNNIIPMCIYFTARHCIEHTWINDRDQYLWPNDAWEEDRQFQTDCLAFTIFSRSNNIRSVDGVNHWIPFREIEVDAQNNFRSHVLLDYIAGRSKPSKAMHTNEQLDMYSNIMEETAEYSAPMVFSAEAKAVFDRARDVWRYYHTMPKADPNASFYDIREYFQGRNAKGVMNPGSTNEIYNSLIEAFNQAYQALSNKIESKIYLYGFLLK